jgi:hypothetical protein
MAIPISPERGGFLRSFYTGIFIRDFLAGRGPFGSPAIDPEVGACQEDIFYHYKQAIIRAYAEDAVAYEVEERIRKKLPPYTEEEIDERLRYYLERIPYKLTSARYHSFRRYFHWLKQLGWVEFTGREEHSSMQDYYPKAPPRRYYRLTKKGLEAPYHEWSRPQRVLYPEIGGVPLLAYTREKRSEHHYTKKVPTKSRVRAEA